MAIQDGKKIILTDAVQEAKKNKPHDTIQEAAQDVFGSMPEIIEETKRRGKQKHKGDFFIEILIKIERVALDPVHPYINATRTCPNPHFSQAVMHYEKDKDQLKLLWVLPDQTNSVFYKLDPSRFNKANVDYLLDHEAGKLQKLANDINKSIKN